jgi:ketosteroid isomerase-like protein
MKISIMANRIFLLMFSFLVYTSANAQKPDKEIESSIETLNKAMISPDKSTLDKLTAEDLSYGHSTGAVQNKSEFIKDVLSGPVKFFQIDNANQIITVTDNTAIVRNICSIKGTRDGAPLDLKIGILMIWIKKGEGWKLLARQGYKLP